MSKFLLSSVVFAFAFAVVMANSISFAQDVIADEPHEDFRIEKNIGIGLTGIYSQTHFLLTDSHGVTFDTYTLLRSKQVRKQAGISPELYAELSLIHTEAVTEMRSTSMVVATYSDEYRDKLKAKFMLTETELRSLLDADQLASLELARIRTGVQQVGPKYLSQVDIADSLGLSKSVVAAIGEQSEELIETLLTRKSKLLKQANQRLLEQLTDQQQASIKELLSEETLEEFMGQELFIGGYVSQKKPIDLVSRSLSALRLRSVQRKIELSTDQADRFGELKEGANSMSGEELETSLRELLTKAQSKQLFNFVIGESTKNRGTVNTFCGGGLDQLLSLSDDQCTALFEAAKGIQVKLVGWNKEACHEIFTEKFALSNEQANRISAALCPPAFTE